MNQNHSFWEREEWFRPPKLFIAGGGIVGASTALFYKEKFPGHDVILVDKGMAPEGASTRNAGFACIGSISEHLADLAISGEEVVLNRIKRRWNGLRLLHNTLEDFAVHYQPTGGYEIFTDQVKFDACRKKIDFMNRCLHKKLGVEGIYSEVTYQGYPAIYNRVEGALNSGRLMRSLHTTLSESGVRTWWNCEVTSVETNCVILNHETKIHPEKTVLAVNGFISGLTDLPVKPARGYLFVTKPIKNLKWKGTFHFNEGYVYFRNIGDKLLLGGGRNLDVNAETTDQFGTNPTIKNYLLNFADEVLKLPKNWEIDIEWSGIMGMTENKEPIVSEIKPGVWAAAGLSGMGIAIGMQVARDLVGKFNH